MRKLLIVQSLVIFISSCAVLPKSDLADSTLFTIDEGPTLTDEFLYVYEKKIISTMIVSILKKTLMIILNFL